MPQHQDGEFGTRYHISNAEMVRDIEKDDMKRSFVSALAQFAGDLDIPLIAQGVESY